MHMRQVNRPRAPGPLPSEPPASTSDALLPRSPSAGAVPGSVGRSGAAGDRPSHASTDARELRPAQVCPRRPRRSFRRRSQSIPGSASADGRRGTRTDRGGKRIRAVPLVHSRAAKIHAIKKTKTKKHSLGETPGASSYRESGEGRGEPPATPTLRSPSVPQDEPHADDRRSSGSAKAGAARPTEPVPSPRRKPTSRAGHPRSDPGRRGGGSVGGARRDERRRSRGPAARGHGRSTPPSRSARGHGSRGVGRDGDASV